MLGPLEQILSNPDLDGKLVREPVETAHRNATRLLKIVNTDRVLSERRLATRYVVTIAVKYNLIATSTGKIVHKGAVNSQVSYDAISQPYAAIAARSDAQQRAATDVARKIQIDLAAWMTKNADR